MSEQEPETGENSRSAAQDPPSPPQLAVSRDRERAWLVQIALGLVWGVMVWLVVREIVAPGGSESLAMAVSLLCALPFPLSICAGALLAQRLTERAGYTFLPGLRAGASTYTSATAWNDTLRQVLTQWEFEKQLGLYSLDRVLVHAEILGCLTSVTLATCALLLHGQLDQPYAAGAIPMRISAAITVCATAGASFTVGLARIVVRVARRDGSGRMFAWVTRTLLLSVLGALLLVLLLATKDPPVLSTVPGFVSAGIAVAILGEPFLQSINDRAAKMLGMTVPAKGANGADLRQLDGFTEDEIVRLAEEGISNVHALAFAPTPRLYFATPFTLQRICNWQDQALLLVYTQSRATNFRDQLMVYGAMDAQVLAERLLSSWSPAAPSPGAPAPEPQGGEATPPSPPSTDLSVLTGALGFPTLEQADVALRTLASDEVIRRLRVYNAGTVQRLDPKAGRRGGAGKRGGA